MADLMNGSSSWSTGTQDSTTTLQNLVDEKRAQHINGVAAFAIALQTKLGVVTSLIGNLADLATRLAVGMDANGIFNLTAFKGLTVDRGLMAVSTSQLQVMNHTPIGVVQAFSGSSAPANWLLCDGSAVDRTTYAKLFAITSTTYGVGNGTTTFNVPDLQGRTIIMVDGSANRITGASTNGGNADTLGGVGGEEAHTLTIANMPGHTHPDTEFTSSGPGAAHRAIYGVAGQTTNASAASGDVASQGGGGAHSNTQPWMALNYIIFTGV